MMGKTVESYRIALDIEIQSWKGFERALRTDDEKLMNGCWMLAETMFRRGSNATRPEMFEPMVMSILLEPAEEANQTPEGT